MRRKDVAISEESNGGAFKTYEILQVPQLENSNVDALEKKKPPPRTQNY